jgi:hypothetical protein
MKCSCKGCDKTLRPGCHSTDNMCPTCLTAGHWGTSSRIVQRCLHGYEYNQNKFQLIRNCAVCGHLLNIWIDKKTREVPKKLWHSNEMFPVEAFPELANSTKIEREYWECAICVSKGQ